MEAIPSIHTVALVLTSRCNLRCAYCFENARSGASMPWSAARRALDAGLDGGSRALRVVFFGGEPTLEFATIRKAVGHVAARRATRRVVFELVTNGTRLGDEELAFLAAHRIATQVSFDGVREAQAFRGSGTFERVVSRLDALRAEHRAFFDSSVAVAMTVTPRAIPHLARSVEFLLAKRVRDIRLAPDIGADREWRASMIGDLDRAVAEVARLSRAHLRDTGRVPVGLFRRDARRFRRPAGSVAMCSVARGGHLSVDVDGSVLVCAVFARSIQRFQPTALGSMLGALDLGDVREGALPERVAAIPVLAKSLRIFHDKKDKFSSHGRCGACRHLHECGVCPASIVQIPGNDDPDRVPEFVCAFNRVWLKHRSRFPALRRAVARV